MKNLIAEVSSMGLNLIYPIYCQGCGQKLSYDNKNYLCEECIKIIKLKRPPFCIKCGKSLYGDREIKGLCPDCLNTGYHFTAAWQCCEYDGLVKELIHKFKYNGKLFLKNIFIDIIYRFSRAYIDREKIDYIAAVPMSKALLQKKGYNHADLLAKGLAELLGVPFLKDCLLKIKNTKQQVSLNRPERLTNLQGAFLAKNGLCINGKNILLIDDVFTTGATVDECSKTLLEAYANSVLILTLARGL
jgi:ComF family protein